MKPTTDINPLCASCILECKQAKSTKIIKCPFRTIKPETKSDNKTETKK